MLMESALSLFWVKEAQGFSEALVNLYLTTLHQIPVNSIHTCIKYILINILVNLSSLQDRLMFGCE